MKARKQVVIFSVLFLLLVLPPMVYFYVTRGFNTFIKLEVIGQKDHKIADFSFINQNNEVVINDSLEGNIYIANFFFTSCPTICPVMTKNMAYVQSKLSVYPNIKFLSHTVDPANDTPERMRHYINDLKGQNVNISLDNWDFVTGDKDELYKIAESYLVSAGVEDSLEPGGFLHSEYFVLIDKEGRIRSGIDQHKNTVGAYDGTNDAKMKDLINDVKVLMAEYKRPTKENEK